MRDLARLTCLSGLATGIIMLFDLIYHSRPISGAVLIFGAVFNTAAIAGVRFLWRLVLTMRNAKANKPEDNTPLSAPATPVRGPSTSAKRKIRVSATRSASLTTT